MKKLAQYILEKTDINKFHKGKNFDIYVANVPAVVEYLKNKFPEAFKGKDADWAQFDIDKIDCAEYDPAYADKYFSLEVDKEDCNEFMQLLIPYEEDMDNIDIDDVIDMWDNQSKKFCDTILDILGIMFTAK